jgi:putative DNA primase/helicase
VLAWLIDGAAKWHASGLMIPSKVRDASAEYMQANDDVGLWLEECCQVGPGFSDGANELYACFRLWKQDRGEHAPSQTTWGERMTTVPGVVRKKISVMRYFGVALKPGLSTRIGPTDRTQDAPGACR